MNDTYQVDHLFLLIGGNPLPNAVAGKSLVLQGGAVTLLHSRETAAVAERLRTWLCSNGVSHVELKQVEESSSASIFSKVQDQIQRIQAQTLGLHYTGGTKAMSVHAYRAIERWAKEHDSVPVFSYLDARKLRMVFDPASPATGQQNRSVYVGRSVDMTLEDLLQLHGWTLQHAPTEKAVLPRSAVALAIACANNDAFDAWKEWTHRELRSKCRLPNKDAWKHGKALISNTLAFPNHDLLRDVVEALQQELEVSADHLDLSQFPNGSDAKHLCEWLDGKWLEHYVLDIIRSMATRLDLHQCAQNIETMGVLFDVDVVALRGYQLFACSCSTDSGKSLLKSKLFEAYIRARQLGGDEARVALVCCSDAPELVELEMRRDIDPEGRICVFGRKHLPRLAEYVSEWIQSQTGEE